MVTAGRTRGADAYRSGQLPRTLQQTVVLSGPNDGGQVPLLHAQEGSEIGSEEGALLEWCKLDTGLRPVSGGNYICACYYQLTNCQQYSLTCS